LKVAEVTPGAINLNVDGRQLEGPVQGFGQLWQKTYRVRLPGNRVSPEEVIRVWKEKFPTFWPKGNRFYGSLSGIQAGDIAVLNLAGPLGMTAPGGRPVVSTGIMVIYADDESFSFMTPQGHMFSGMNTFSAYEDDGGVAVQIQVLVRASDPLYELGCRLGIVHKTEDDFWKATLKNLAAHFGVEAYPQQSNTLVDPQVQWSYAKNIWHNAAIRTAIYLLLSPLRWFIGLFRKKRS
jgi:hypothetical protein